MKVGELLAKLKRLDAELDVLCYSEESAILPPKHAFRLFAIDTINTAEGEMTRGDDQIPSFKFGKESLSRKIAIIEITSDF